MHAVPFGLPALLAVALAGTPAIAGTAEVAIDGYAFQPQEIRVRAGDTVVWRNDETRTSHEVVFADGTASDRLLPGDTYERAFPHPGRYAYVCDMHKNYPAMAGTVVVEP